MPGTIRLGMVCDYVRHESTPHAVFGARMSVTRLPRIYKCSLLKKLQFETVLRISGIVRC